MARMYSRKKGKSRSTKPKKLVKKSWNIYSAKEVEQLVIKIAKTKNIASKPRLLMIDSSIINPNPHSCILKSLGSLTQNIL